MTSLLPFILSGDEMTSLDGTVAMLLEAGVRVLVYAGDTDFMADWLGCRAWVEAGACTDRSRMSPEIPTRHTAAESAGRVVCVFSSSSWVVRPGTAMHRMARARAKGRNRAGIGKRARGARARAGERAARARRMQCAGGHARAHGRARVGVRAAHERARAGGPAASACARRVGVRASR